MSLARRHHYLPVFLLKHFGITTRGSSARVRVIRRERVFETAVTNVGLERDFHTDTMFPDPERMLSRAEAEFARELTRWKVGSLDDRGRVHADRLIPHLRLRSKIIRRVGHQLMKLAADSTDRAISDVVLRSRPEASLREDVASLLDAAATESLHGSWDATGREVAIESARVMLGRHLSHWAILESARLARFVLDGGLPAEVVDGVHTSLILRALLGHRKFAAFGNCRWALQEVKGSLLLGDVGPLARYVGVRTLKPMYMSSAVLRAIYLPVASNRLLVGWYGHRRVAPSVDALNAATVALSHEFVVGSLAERRMEQLRATLGGRAAEDSAQAILGVDAPDGASLVLDVARAVSKIALTHIDGSWSGAHS